MKPIVATFRGSEGASFAAAHLRATFNLSREAVRTAIASAYLEPYDGHTIVAAWVSDEDEEAAWEMVASDGGSLNPQPWRSAA